LIYADPARRANHGVLLNNRRGQNGLWSYGISGDSPIVLLRISDTEKIEIVRQLHPGAFLLAHERTDR
jgi:cyclic beta-1,2-glucan synthetase